MIFITCALSVINTALLAAVLFMQVRHFKGSYSLSIPKILPKAKKATVVDLMAVNEALDKLG